MGMNYKKIISENVNRLSAMRGWKEVGRPGILARESGISYRMAKYVLDAQREPSVEYLDKIAKAFNVSIHQLITPALPDELLSSSDFKELLKNYATASQEGRELINLQAKREANIETEGGGGKRRPFNVSKLFQ